MITVNLPQKTMNGKIPAKLKKFILNQPVFESYLLVVTSYTSRMSYFSTQDYIPTKKLTDAFGVALNFVTMATIINKESYLFR